MVLLLLGEEEAAVHGHQLAAIAHRQTEGVFAGEELLEAGEEREREANVRKRGELDNRGKW